MTPVVILQETAAPIAGAVAARPPLGRLADRTGLSAVLWSASFAAIRWSDGGLTLRLFRDVEHSELPCIALAMAISLVILHWRRTRRGGAKAGGPRPTDVADA
jgi:hypothetical protein